MSTRDEQRAAGARRRLAELAADMDATLPGGLVERMTRCGKENCRCNGEPPQLHGPYFQWGYSKGRKRFTRWLTVEQAERYRPEINRSRRLMELLEALDEAEIRRVERAEGWGT